MYMENLSYLAQIIVAAAIVIVWVFRYDNIILEFKQYGLSDLTRTTIGSTKIVLATLLVVGIWYHSLILIPAMIMGFLMLSAQYFHFKVKNPIQKYLPSLFLLILCIFISLTALKVL